MAEVFRGVAESIEGFKKSVAIKRILPNLTKNQKFVSMFLDEARLSLFLQHANKTDYKRPAEIVMEVPIWVNTLVDQLMEKEPAKRPINAKAAKKYRSKYPTRALVKISNPIFGGWRAAQKRWFDPNTGLMVGIEKSVGGPTG